MPETTTQRHTPRDGFVEHLITLKNAINQVQPLADHRGNVVALHAIVMLGKALEAVRADLSDFWADENPAQIEGR